MKSMRTKTSGERRLIDFSFIAAGAAALFAGGKVAVLIHRHHLLNDLREKLSAYSASLSWITAGALTLGALMLIFCILLGSGAVLHLFKAKAGRKIERMCLFVLAAMFLSAAAGMEAGGERLVYRLIPENAVTEYDRGSVSLLVHGGAAALLLCGFSSFLLALSFTKKQTGKRRPVLIAVSAAASVCLIAFSLAVYYRFSKTGFLFSSIFSRALSIQINAEMFIWFCDAMFALACAYILFSFSGRKRAGNNRGLLTVFGSLCLFFTAFSALKSFVDVLCRYSLFSKYISVFTLVKHPLTALCLIALGFAMNMRAGRPLAAAGALLLCGTEIYAQIISRTPIIVNRFSAAFETALPLVSIAFWALFFIMVCIPDQRRILKGCLLALCLITGAAPAILSVLYYAENLQFMRTALGIDVLIEKLFSLYLLPAVGRTAAALRSRKGVSD